MTQERPGQLHNTPAGKGAVRARCVSFLAAGFLLAAVLMTGRFWFDLNDDLFMEHILSGAYTGVPESRNIQNLFPASLAVSILYRLFDRIPWYGLILILLQLGCIAIIVYRLERARKNSGIPAAALLGGLLFYHLAFLQYSVTVGIMACCVIVLILTAGESLTLKDAGREYLPAFILLLAGYALRSEMMLFMLPFILLALLFRLVLQYRFPEEGFSSLKKVLARFLAMALIAAAGIGLVQASDEAACSSAKWREFRRFFDARTELYDFQRIPEYEGNEAFYDGLGLDPSEAALLKNYNFGLDERIDAGVMEQTASYAGLIRAQEDPFKARLKRAVYEYRMLFTDQDQRPYNILSAILYLSVLAGILAKAVLRGKQREPEEQRAPEAQGPEQQGTAQQKREKIPPLTAFLVTAALFFGRSVLFLYLLYNERPVVRLTHCLYLAECVILFAVLLMLSEEGFGKKTVLLYAVVLTAVFAWAFFFQVRNVRQEDMRRLEVNRPYRDYLSYAEEHGDQYFFTDVYSTVAFSEEVFGDEPSPLNWDLCGGWACKSPLYEKKLAMYLLDSMESALLEDPYCRFVTRSDYDIEWLYEYYRSRGVEIRAELTDTLSDYWSIYRIEVLR